MPISLAGGIGVASLWDGGSEGHLPGKSPQQRRRPPLLHSRGGMRADYREGPLGPPPSAEPEYRDALKGGAQVV